MGSLKTWFTSRTNWFGLAILVMGSMQEWLASAPIPEEYGGLVTMGTGAVIMILRKLTTGPVGGGGTGGNVGSVSMVFLLCACLLVLPACMQFGGSMGQEIAMHEGEPILIDGEPVLLCKVDGIALIQGNASICDAMTGGRISEPFAAVLTGLWETVTRVVAGIFTGLGGIGAALAPPEE